MTPAAPKVVSTRCIICGAEFSYVRKPGPGRQRRTCSDECFRRQHNRHNRRWRARGQLDFDLAPRDGQGDER